MLFIYFQFFSNLVKFSIIAFRKEMYKMKIPDSYVKKVISETNYQNKLLKKVNDNLFLSQSEIELLELYHIPYSTCTSIKDLIFLIEEEMEYDCPEELEMLSQNLSERDYYFYTNK